MKSSWPFFPPKLSLLKQDIHNSAGATTEHLREDTVVVPDLADRATIEEEHALELRTRDRERKFSRKSSNRSAASTLETTVTRMKRSHRCSAFDCAAYSQSVS
jgi:RNA polymerase-binding transcription factor DksA